MQEREGQLVYASKNGEPVPMHDQSRKWLLQTLALSMLPGEPDMAITIVAHHLSRSIHFCDSMCNLYVADRCVSKTL